MNFVGHAYLSFGEDEFLYGNTCADFLSRTFKSQVTGRLQEGVQAHSLIDDFTDKHASFKKLKSRLFPLFGHYASVVIDLYYDYCLVANWECYSSEKYVEFTQEVYRVLASKSYQQNEKELWVSNAMINQDWFGRYQTFDGMRMSFFDMSRRTSGSRVMKNATDFLEQNESYVRDLFDEFFPELIVLVKRQFFNDFKTV